MAKSEFEKIPTLLEEMKSTWGKINHPNPKNIKLDKSDLETIRNAFIAAKNYEDLNDRWLRACTLFYHKDDLDQSGYEKALRKAVEIMGIVEKATEPGKKERFHPFKKMVIREYYTWSDFFLLEDENGCYYDEEGNAFGNKRDYKKQRIKDMVKEFGFASPGAAEKYLRETLGLKNVPSFKDHSKRSK